MFSSNDEIQMNEKKPDIDFSIHVTRFVLTTSARLEQSALQKNLIVCYFFFFCERNNITIYSTLRCIAIPFRSFFVCFDFFI